MQTNDVKLYHHAHFGDIRTLTDDNGEPWFIATDIAKALGYRNAPDMTRQLDEDEKGYANLRTLGGEQQLTAITEAGFYKAVLTRNAQSKASQEVKNRIKEFKRWVTHEVLPSIRKHGGYIRPDATEHQVNALIFQARARMELCQAAKGLIHPDHLEAKARSILAQGMGEYPALDPGRAPLYVQAFLKEKNLPAAKLRKVSGTFGRRVKAAYVLKHGCDPQKYPLEIKNGQIKNVYAYTEADRPLLEQVWKDHYQSTNASGDVIPFPKTTSGWDEPDGGGVA